MSADLNMLMDVILIFAGGYMIFNAIMMKKNGSVMNNGMISKGLDLNKAPDPMGYIKCMFPVDLIAGALFIICGVVSRVADKMGFYDAVSNPLLIVIIVVMIAFAYISVKAQNKYLKK